MPRFVSRSLFVIALVFPFGLNPAFAEPNPHAFENWKTDFETYNIPLYDVISGGPMKDGIPSIDEPEFVSFSEATHLDGREPVITLEHKGEARAYPLQVLMWHEIANDDIAGDPFAVTYCPLCNAAIVFDARLDGKRLDFGTTGRLRNSDLLMYDRQTESWWQQFSGEAVIGELTGRQLRMVPSRVESLDSFRERNPAGKVLVPNNPGLREYGRNPYVNYDSREAPYPLFSGELPDDIPAMARVVVLRRDGKAVAAVTLAKVQEEAGLELDGFKLRTGGRMASALDAERISAAADTTMLTVEDIATGEPGVHDVTFAFVVHAFHPDLPIVK